MSYASLRYWKQLSWRRGFLIVLVATEGAAILSVGRNGGFHALSARLRATETNKPHVASLHDWQLALAHDPKRGTHLPVTTVRDSEDGRLTIGTGPRPGGIFFIASCTNCVSGRLADWDRLQRNHPEMDLCVVSSAPDADLARQFKAWHHLSIRFIVEGQAPLVRVCNPYFLPRAYLFGPTGRLTYVQPSSISTEAALEHIRLAFAGKNAKESRSEASVLGS